MKSARLLPSQKKVITLREAMQIAKRARAQGKTVVTTNGCFDILHSGHIATLEWARRHGDLLIVGIDADLSVRKNKGPLRPILRAAERAKVLAGLAAVDHVFIFSTPNPIPWLRSIKPTIHVKGKGSEKDPRFAPEERIVREGGGRILLAPRVGNLSTSGIVEAIASRYGTPKRTR